MCYSRPDLYSYPKGTFNQQLQQPDDNTGKKPVGYVEDVLTKFEDEISNASTN